MHLDVWTIRGRVFHFGQERGLGMERSAVTWPADSLFAALVARLAAREGPQAVARWMAPFEAGEPPFLLTSTFPCVRADDSQPPLLFFPVPLAALAAEKRPLQDGAVWLTPEEEKRLPRAIRRERRLWKVADRPRVTVGRADNASNLFYVGAVHFPEGAGLWFGVHWRDEASPWKEALENLLADLGESGLGAERNVGYGQAGIASAGTVDLPAPQPDAPWVSLSRYLPCQDEMAALQSEVAAYQVHTVGGWVDRVGQRRRRVRMLAEGATLGPAGRPTPWGQVVDVRPTYPSNPDPLSHPVYRYGYALAVKYGGAP